MSAPLPQTRLDCVKDLISAARNNKFSALRKSTATDQDVYDVWDHVSQLVEYHMSRKKAVQIPGLGVFTFTSSKLDVGHNKYILIQRPVFVLSEKLARTHGLTQTKHHVPGEIPVIQLNFTQLSHDLKVDRDLTEASVKEVVNALSKSIEHTRSGEFGFTTIGNLVINNGNAKMKFLPTFVEQLDQTGGLAKLLSRRPGTSTSVLSDHSIVLPKIQPGDLIHEGKTSPTAAVSRSPNVNAIEEEEGDEDSKKGVKKLSPRSVEERKKRKDQLTATLKVEPKAPSVQQLSIAPTNSPNSTVITPRRVPALKKSIQFKDPRTESAPRPSRVFPLALKLSRTDLLNELLKEKSKGKMDEMVHESASCNSCAMSKNDFCYLCFQRDKRNVPVYTNESRNQFEQEEDRLLQTYTLLKDSESLQKEQEKGTSQDVNVKNQDVKIKKREDAQHIAAFNLSVSETRKQEKDEDKIGSFKRSYVFHRRPITPPHYIKQEDYQVDLAKQEKGTSQDVDVKNQVSDRKKQMQEKETERELMERVEQLQLAEDLAIQRHQYLKSKKLQSDEYRKALDTQVYIKKCLDERNLESQSDRHFSLPRPNILIPFQNSLRVKADNATTVVYRPSELPKAYPDSDNPIFGAHDTTVEKCKGKRKRAKLLYQGQLQQAQQRKEHEVKQELKRKNEEEEMLRKTKDDLLEETLTRNQRNLKQRHDLEAHWAAHSLKKRAREMQEKLDAEAPGVLLQEQCDKYHRCDQCTRIPENQGKSNVWSESRYVSGSRLII